jgi:hypothetical protein
LLPADAPNDWLVQFNAAKRSQFLFSDRVLDDLDARQPTDAGIAAPLLESAAKIMAKLAAA